MPRKTLGDRPLTNAELQARHRARVGARLENQRLEIERLRGWLEYLGGDLAMVALNGAPVPKPRGYLRRLQDLGPQS